MWGVSPCLHEIACVWGGVYKCVPSLEYTTEGWYRNPTGFLIVVFCAANLHPCGCTHSSSQGNVLVVFSSGVKFSCTSNLREGYLPVCMWRGGEIETLSRLPFSSQLQSSHHLQLFGLWAPSPTTFPTLTTLARIKTSQPKSVILWI